MAQYALRSTAACRANGKRQLAPQKNRRRFVAPPLGRPLAIEPLEDRTLLAAGRGINLELLASDTPLTAVDLSSLSLASFPSGGRQVPVFSGEWLVKLAPDSDGASLAEGLAAARESLTEHVKGLTSVEGLASADTFLIRTSADYSLAGISSALAGIDGFASVEPNFLAWKDDTIPNDPSLAAQWALHNIGQNGGVVDADIDAPLAWDVNTGSGKAVVGVVDSGVDYTHADLDDNMWRNPGEIPGDGIDNEGNGFVDDIFGYDFLNGDSDPLDDEGHGTSVAGIIAAEGNNGLGVVGVNWDAQIMALKIFDPLGFAGTAQIVGAINYATMMKRDFGVDVIATNHSWGTVGFSTVLRDAIAVAGAEDILFVASAGNSRHDNDIAPQYPASYDLDNIISVAATDRFDNRASFTSFGATTVDLGAPGVSTFTTARGGGYRNFSGTSAAAPYVTGVAALVHDTYPKASALAVKEAILDGVDPIAAMAGITLTGGRLNAFGAVRAMPMQVVAASPDDGDIVSTPPLDFTIETALAIDPATVNAADLEVNGLSADSVTIVNPTTLTFSFTSSPVISQGAQEVRIADGAFARAFDAQGIKEFVATFQFDALRLEVLATVPGSAAIVPWPVTSIRIDFNEAVNPLSVDVGDLRLSEGSVSGFTVVDSDTIEYQLAGVASDRRLIVAIPVGAVSDNFGNPNLAFSTTLDVDADLIPAAAFQRLQPLGGLIFASRAAGRLTSAADSDRFNFFTEEGQTVAVRVTPMDTSASISAELVGIAVPVASAGPGQPAVLAPTLISSDGTVALKITGDRATDYRVEIVRNAAIEDPAQSPQNITNSGIALGSLRFGVVGLIDGPGQVDRYELDLSASLGRRVDIVLAGQDGVRLTGATLELVAPDGTIVTAAADPLDNGATNYNLAILGFVPNQVGNYQLQLSSPVRGEYAIVVTVRLLFESEVNDGPLGYLRSLDEVDGIAGFIDSSGQTGLFAFEVDASRSFIAISGGVGNPQQGILAPFQPQAPGSLESNLTGTVEAVVSSNSIRLLPKTSIFPFEKPGPFQPGNAPADFAASLNFPPFIVGGVLAMRDTAFGMVVTEVGIDPSGNFAADAFSLALREDLAANIPGVFNDTVQLDDTFVDNQATTPGSLRLVDGRLELILPIQVRMLFPVPQLPLAGIFDFTGQIVATTIVAGPDDLYSVSLAPGETLAVETRTPFDDPASTPANSLDPALRLLDASGAVVAVDTDSATDGKNAMLKFTSPAGGTYTIHVLSSAGQGEYVISIDKNLPPVLDPIGNRTVSEGDTLSFTAQAADPDLNHLAYSLGPGAPGGASIDPTSGKFTWKPPDNTGSPFTISVMVTDDGSPQLTDSESILVTVNNVAPKIESVLLTAPPLPKEGDLIRLAVTFTDAGIFDTHTAVVNWGDGTTTAATVTEANGSGRFVASRVLTSGGTLTVAFTLTDDDGGAATGQKSLLVTGVGIRKLGDLTILQIIGSNGHDYVSITPTRNGKLNVFASFLPWSNRTLSSAGLDLIDARGLGGNDLIRVGSAFGAVMPPAIIDGGDGDDTIMGGSGGNILMGGRGNDELFAGVSRDILIGGQGADRLFGKGGDDILIAGYTSYDAGAVGDRRSNDLALLDLLKEWQSMRSYNARVDNIVNGTGPILEHSLKKGLTVFDDNQKDSLWGGAGRDWFFLDWRDTALGKKAGEWSNN